VANAAGAGVRIEACIPAGAPPGDVMENGA